MPQQQPAAAAHPAAPPAWCLRNPPPPLRPAAAAAAAVLKAPALLRRAASVPFATIFTYVVAFNAATVLFMMSSCLVPADQRGRAGAPPAGQYARGPDDEEAASWWSSIFAPGCRDPARLLKSWDTGDDGDDSVFEEGSFPLAPRGAAAAARRQVSFQWPPPQGTGASRFPHAEAGAPSISFPAVDLTGLRRSAFSTRPGDVAFDDVVVSKIFQRALHPTSITPFFVTGERTPNPDEVTISTHATMDRIEVFMALVARNQGPISCALHVNDDEHAHSVLEFVREMRAASPLMRRNVDVHVVRDSYERQYNLLRNVARLFARTDYFLLLDVDFSVRTDLQRALADALREGSPLAETMRSGEAALVLPAFEYADPAVEPALPDPVTHEPGVQDLIAAASSTRFNGTSVKLGVAPPVIGRAWRAAARSAAHSPDTFFPVTKEDLMSQIETGRITVFHARWPRGHYSTDYPRWYESTAPYVVTEYEATYEPYVIARKDAVPWCEERFVGYGANKASCIMQMYISGVSFWVSPDAFVMHQSHGYPEADRQTERPQNRRLYDRFVAENCVERAREFAAAGLWNSPRAYNLRRHCEKKLRGLGELLDLDGAGKR